VSVSACHVHLCTKCMLVYMYIHTCVCMFVCVYIRMSKYTYIQIYIHTYKYTRTYTYAFMHPHVHPYTHKIIRTHTLDAHTYSPRFSRAERVLNLALLGRDISPVMLYWGSWGRTSMGPNSTYISHRTASISLFTCVFGSDPLHISPTQDLCLTFLVSRYDGALVCDPLHISSTEHCLCLAILGLLGLTPYTSLTEQLFNFV